MIRDDRPDSVRRTDAQFRETIERATRLPTPTDGVTLAELRQIASEPDIDPAALTLALRDVLERQPPKRIPRHSWLHRLGALAGGLLPRRG